jgi:hypothetical protein
MKFLLYNIFHLAITLCLLGQNILPQDFVLAR